VLTTVAVIVVVYVAATPGTKLGNAAGLVTINPNVPGTLPPTVEFEDTVLAAAIAAGPNAADAKKAPISAGLRNRPRTRLKSLIPSSSHSAGRRTERRP
jgi:hypothetical protein